MNSKEETWKKWVDSMRGFLQDENVPPPTLRAAFFAGWDSRDLEVVRLNEQLKEIQEQAMDLLRQTNARVDHAEEELRRQRDS